MPLVSSVEPLQKAKKMHYAIPAFAIYNMETVQAVIAAADELQSPVILQTTPATIRSSGIAYISALVTTAAATTRVPVILHLDHGETLEDVLQCLRNGYTSVMIDGSALSFEENVALTQAAVRMAHAVDVAVEAELGHVGQVGEDSTKGHTDPAVAEVFVGQTGIDSLAVAIGTAHGVYQTDPNLDYVRLGKLSQASRVPLVLHGASGVPDEQLREAIKRGISKFNIATELKIPFANALRSYLTENPKAYDPRKYMRQAKQAYQEAAQEKIMLAGSSGKA